MKYISILGSTGSIGTQALTIIRNDPASFRVTALSVYENIELLEAQIQEFRPETVCVFVEEKAKELKKKAASRFPFVEVLSGMEGLIACAVKKGGGKNAQGAAGTESAAPDEEITLVAVSGMIGIRPSMEAIKAGKDIALSNKETLVCAGHLIMPLVKQYGVELMPVDSEHSAIWQCLRGERHADIDRLYITASGGPFRGKSREQLKTVRAEDALRHPNWSMGRKVTIDSATLANKALEVMEAHWLFDVDYDRISVLVQPRSIIHSLVGFRDGAVKAQLGVPSMLIPIEYALYKGLRHSIEPPQHLDLFSLKSIEFELPDTEVFRALALGTEAGRTGGSMPAVFNAADEEAVAAFLSGRIAFLDIAELIGKAMERHLPDLVKVPDVSEILEAEAKTRAYVRSLFCSLD